MSTPISRWQKFKMSFARTGSEITVPAQPMSEREQLFAMILAFLYSALGFSFGIYCLFKGVELFETGVLEGHGSWKGIGIQFQDLAPGTLLFIIGGLCFKTSAFTVRIGSDENGSEGESNEPKQPTQPSA